MKKKNIKGKRLLTEEERNFLLESYQKRNVKLMIVILVISAIFFALMGKAFGGIEGLVMFLLPTVGLTIFICQHLITLAAINKKVLANEMYASEAIYDHTSGKYHHVYLKGYKRSGIEGYDLMVREPLEKGDRVIVLDMRYPAWVYKARRK